MYDRVQKSSSSFDPSIQKKKSSKYGPRTFSFQPKRDTKSSPPQDLPKYSPAMADRLYAKLMGSMEAQAQRQADAEALQRKEEQGAAPVEEAVAVSQQSQELGIQRQCLECQEEQRAQAIEEGKDSDEMSSVAGVEAQLTVGAPGDKYEPVADRVAEQVMAMPDPATKPQPIQRLGEEEKVVQKQSLAGSITPLVQRQEDEDLPPGGQELIDTVANDANDIIRGPNAASKSERRRQAATARARSPESVTMTPHFENMRPPNITQNFPGLAVQETLDDQDIMSVTDINEFMDNLKAIYNQYGTPLHEKLEEKIRNLVSEEGRTFSSRNGVPGLHAEVQAVNARLHQLAADGVEITEEVLAQVQVATYRVTPNPAHLEGQPFPACRNCTDILNGTNILTGVTPR